MEFTLVAENDELEVWKSVEPSSGDLSKDFKAAFPFADEHGATSMTIGEYVTVKVPKGGA